MLRLLKRSPFLPFDLDARDPKQVFILAQSDLGPRAISPALAGDIRSYVWKTLSVFMTAGSERMLSTTQPSLLLRVQCLRPKSQLMQLSRWMQFKVSCPRRTNEACGEEWNAKWEVTDSELAWGSSFIAKQHGQSIPLIALPALPSSS